MTKSKKPRTRSARKVEAPAVRMGVPTIADRLEAIDANIVAAAALLGFESDDLSTLEPRVYATAITKQRATMVCQLLGKAWSDLYWVQEVKEAADLPAPTEDQRSSFERIGASRGNAGGAR
jgi:hypothetical protein